MRRRTYIKILILVIALTMTGTAMYFAYYKKSAPPAGEQSTPASESAPAPGNAGSNVFTDPRWGYTLRYPMDYTGKETQGSLDLFHTNASGAEVLAIQTAVYENFNSKDPRDTAAPLNELAIKEIERQCGADGPKKTIYCAEPKSEPFRNPFDIKGWKISMIKITETFPYDPKTETNLGQGPHGGTMVEKKGVGPVFVLDLSPYTSARALFIVPTDTAYVSTAEFVVNSLHFPTGTNKNGK